NEDLGTNSRDPRETGHADTSGNPDGNHLEQNAGENGDTRRTGRVSSAIRSSLCMSGLYVGRAAVGGFHHMWQQVDASGSQSHFDAALLSGIYRLYPYCRYCAVLPLSWRVAAEPGFRNTGIDSSGGI